MCMIQSSSPIQSVNEVVRGLIGPEMTPAVHIALRCLKIYHEIWWIYQKQRVYRDPNRWLYLGAGYVLNQTLGKYEAVKKTFQIYTIALRVYDLTVELKSFKKAWNEWCWAVKNQYPMRYSVKWDDTDAPKNIYQDRIERIMQCTGNLFIAIGNVSARCIEVYNAFYMENNHEIVCDIIRGIDEIKKQDSVQIVFIKITNAITPLISDTIKAEDLIKSIDDFFAQSNRIQNILKTIKNKPRIIIDTLFEGYSPTTSVFRSYTHPESLPKQLLSDHTLLPSNN